MIKLLIADDHPVVRKGIRNIITDCKDIQIESEASNGFEVLSLIKKKKFDVILLDINMPGLNGIDTLIQIKKIQPSLAVLILSFYPEKLYGTRLLKSGASGYVSKESNPDELLTAIHKVAGGGKFITPAIAETLVDMCIDHNIEPHHKLSNRELQVLQCIASGKSVKDIADELMLSINTISTYRVRLLEKMKMQTSAQLTSYAIRNNIV